MSGYGFFRVLQMVALVGFFALAGLFFSAFVTCSEISHEITFRRTYGDNWKTEFENRYGSLTKARTQAAVGVVGFISVGSVTAWLYRLLRPNRSGSPVTRKKKHRRFGSNMERLVHYRARGYVRVYFGVIGIVAGIFLVLFRIGIFSSHSDEIVLGMFVFLAGYCGVIAGCSGLLKAKGQNEAIVFIGLMPLGVLFVPFVRLIFLRAPLLLLVGMVMMPIILITVVLVLPDRSGISRRRSAWRTKSAPRPFLAAMGIRGNQDAPKTVRNPDDNANCTESETTNEHE